MKMPASMRWSVKVVLLSVWAAVGAWPSFAADNAAQSELKQNKADQQEIRNHTAAVVAQIQGLIDELAANGISGDDIHVLQTTKAVLNNLTSKEMERVLASLQKATETPGASVGQQNVVDAYAGQKGIILQFRQILKEYEERQAAYELPTRFKELTDRQTETLLTSADVARTTAGKANSQLSSMDQTTVQIAQADQEAIANEANLAIDQLNKAAQGATGENAKAMQQALKDLQNGKLQKALNQANEDLKAGQLLKAINEQKVARDELRRTTKDLNPAATAVDALTSTAADLGKLIDDQKKLVTKTTAASPIKPHTTGLDKEQAVLVDKANSLQEDMQAMSADAAALIKASIDPMQQSRAALANIWSPDYSKALDDQQTVISKLEEAQKLLQTQLTDAEKAAEDANKNPVAKLQDMQKQIQAEMQKQQQVTQQTQQAVNNITPDPAALADAKQQQDQVQQQTDALQKDAQPLSLDAAKALADAAKQMNQAQQDLADPAKAADAQAAQQAAQQALAQANQQIGQQIADAQQQTADPSALAAADDALQKAQDAVSKALGDANPTPPATPDTQAAMQALADANKNAQAAANTPGLPQAATQALQDAQAAIAQGQQQAAQKNAKGTSSKATAAQQALAQAQAAVALAQAGMMASNTPTGDHPNGPDSQSPNPNPTGTKPGTKPTTALGGGSLEKGTEHAVSGAGKFVSVAARDRMAIEQSQSEKRPQEYAPMIDQYLKNLADQSSSTQ